MGYIFQLEPAKYIEQITPDVFDEVALSLFRHQYDNNSIYKQYVDALNVSPTHVASIESIPYLPVSFYKTHEVVCGAAKDAQIVFSSSSTTADIPGKHYVKNLELYIQACMHGFKSFYGNIEDYAIVALLPSYLQREGASLVYMVERFMEHSQHPLNGFYLDEYAQLNTVLKQLEAKGQKTLLIGVTFALLDFAEAHPMQLKHTIVMETGGMKGRRKELTREEVHEFLKKQLGIDNVHSEYGMTELLSQAYALKDGMFRTSATMKVLARDINDPFELHPTGTGCLNIIDLANVHSCAFIATDDITRIHNDGSFEVLGRADHSALRGCNLMVL